MKVVEVKQFLEDETTDKHDGPHVVHIRRFVYRLLCMHVRICMYGL